MPSNSDMSGFPKGGNITPMGLNSSSYTILEPHESSTYNRGLREVGTIDFQTLRTSPTQIPLGATSGVFGYQNSVAAGSISSFSFGNNNVNSASYFITLGSSNTGSGAGSFAAGISNAANGPSAMAIGNTCTASGGRSFTTGQTTSSLGVTAKRTMGFSSHSVRGVYVLRAETTNATPTALTANAGAVGTNNQVSVGPTGGYTFIEGRIVAKQSGSSNSAFWTIVATAHRSGGAATTTLVVSTVTSVSNVPGWTAPSLSADTTNGRITITVTGNAATNIRWVSTVKGDDVTYP